MKFSLGALLRLSRFLNICEEFDQQLVRYEFIVPLAKSTAD